MAEQDDAQVQEIRARLEAATPGPWLTLKRAPDLGATEIGAQLDTPDARVIADTELWGRKPTEQNVQDAAFIAHAREDVPYLLARLDALTAERDVLRVERDIARRVEQESSAAADAWQAEAVKVRAERDALAARLAAAESALSPCTLALEYRDGVTCREERDRGVCLNHRVIEGLRVHAVTADRLEIENRALRRQVRATYGIIHEGLHGGKPTDPEHQELCERPSCRNARAALAEYAQHDPGCYALHSRFGEAAACKCGFYEARAALAARGGEVQG